MKLGEKIAYYRRVSKLSQEELAARIGVSRQAVSKWELGETSPDVDRLLGLAGVFGVTTDHLLSEEDPAETAERPTPQVREEIPEEAEKAGPGEDLPGFLGRMVRRWGWLAGVYLALHGAGIALVGVLARWGFGSMFAASGEMMGQMGDLSGWSYSGPPELESAIMGELGAQAAPLSGLQGFFLGFATVVIVVGVIVMIAGVVLAVVLRRRGRK